MDAVEVVADSSAGVVGFVAAADEDEVADASWCGHSKEYS